ncbi:PilZ domain-containing protein [Methylomicrobium lacus]|uniref:PilZ domain-containing protein n=1 Tax=Methylomicrobium lacus TaxID=136992 RepID=UPI00045EB4AE|nr:PilZ domain-containing protein [Methylomicrobium lacus]
MSQYADNEDFAALIEEDLIVNQRRTVRYIRKDIAASVRRVHGFARIGLAWFGREIPVELMDISSRGCLIVSAEKLAVGATVFVRLRFDTGKGFEIKGSVIRKTEDREYGIKFVEYNDELGDCMLQTQRELLIK